MMVEVTYQMVLNTLQTTGLLIGIFYYIMVLRNQQKNQEISLRNQEETLKTRKYAIYKGVMDIISSPYGTKAILLIQDNPISSYEEWRELTNSNKEYFQAWISVCHFLEISGIYLKESIMTIDMYAHYLPYWFLGFWRQNKPVIYKIRESVGPSYFRNMEYYMDSLEKYFEEHPELAP